MKERYLTKHIEKDLKEKMVFLGGPRQAGKTTLSKLLTSDLRLPALYLNWDNDQDRKTILKAQWPKNAPIIVLDELHKYARWKNWIKGQYDKFKDRYHFLVTGSAKLNVYRRKGDSLFGRYHYYCLHPFSLREVLSGGAPSKIRENSLFKALKFQTSSVAPAILTQLLEFGGFPEPFLKKSKRFSRRWRQTRVDLLVKDDIRSLEDIKEISLLAILAQLLPSRASSILSINAIREDLEVSHKAIARWISILELVYYCYRIYPYHRAITRSIKKEPKLYLWDWSEVEDPGARFENLIAGHLLKFVHFLQHYHGFKADLFYLRTLEKKEVDFLVAINEKPWFAVEAKLADTIPSKNLLYFQERLKIPFLYQVVRTSKVDTTLHGIHVLSAEKFLTALI